MLSRRPTLELIVCYTELGCGRQEEEGQGAEERRGGEGEQTACQEASTPALHLGSAWGTGCSWFESTFQCL